MPETLEAFYRGKLYPGEMKETKNAEQRRREYIFTERQNQLFDQLDQETKKACMGLFEEANALSACDCEQAYIEGMRMGARLAAELLFLNENK